MFKTRIRQLENGDYKLDIYQEVNGCTSVVVSLVGSDPVELEKTAKRKMRDLEDRLERIWG